MSLTSRRDDLPPGDAGLSLSAMERKLQCDFNGIVKSEQPLEEERTETSPTPHEAAWLLLPESPGSPSQPCFNLSQGLSSPGTCQGNSPAHPP